MNLYRNYDDERIYKYLKKAKKCFLVAMIISIIMICVDITYLILYFFNVTDSIINTFKNWDFFIIFCYVIFGFLYPIIHYLIYRNIYKGKQLESKLQNDYKTLKSAIWGIYTPLILWLLYLPSSFIDSRYVAYSEMLGRIFFQYLFMIIASVYLIKCAKIVKADYKEYPPDFMEEEIEEKIKAEKIKNDNISLNNYHKFIEVAGKKFFLKYYYIIRDLSFADAMDSIENYSYEDKERRVQAVKKIFSLNLQKFALEKIIQESTGEINAGIKAEAEEIYNNEFTKSN